MIVEFLINIGAGIATWFLSLLPDLDWADGMIVTASNGLSSLMVAAAQISPWFPWPTFVACFVAVIGAYVTLFALKVGRALFAHVPFVGGRG